MIHQSDPIGLLDVNGVPSEDHLLGPAHADDAAQALGAPTAGDDAKPYFRQGKLGVLRRKANVAGKGDLTPAPKGIAIDGSDRHLAHGLQQMGRPVAQFAPTILR